MSLTPSDMASGAAGTPLTQNLGSELQHAPLETARQWQRARIARQAEDAAGVGATTRHQAASDRDPDGRQPCEPPPQEEPPDDPRGRQLDLHG